MYFLQKVCGKLVALVALEDELSGQVAGVARETFHCIPSCFFRIQNCTMGICVLNINF